MKQQKKDIEKMNFQGRSIKRGNVTLREVYMYELGLEGRTQAISKFKEKLIKEVKTRSSFRVVRAEAGEQRIADFKEGEDTGRESERELVLKIIEETAQEIKERRQ